MTNYWPYISTTDAYKRGEQIGFVAICLYLHVSISVATKKLVIGLHLVIQKSRNRNNGIPPMCLDGPEIAVAMQPQSLLEAQALLKWFAGYDVAIRST